MLLFLFPLIFLGREKYSLPYGEDPNYELKRRLIFMYDYELYSEVDTLVGKQLKKCANTIGRTILMVLIWIVLVPIRLWEYLVECFTAEDEINKEIDERFKNLKEKGHI